MIRRVVGLIGTASPSPIPATAVLTPTTRPRPSASAPPELPGLSAASVWITFSTTRPAPTGRARPRALTTPAVPQTPRRHGPRESHRIADGYHELAHAKRRRLAEFGRVEPVSLEPKHR